MNKYTVKALSAIYRNILKKCFLINAGIFLLSAPAIADDLIINKGQTVTNSDLSFTGFFNESVFVNVFVKFDLE